MHLTSISISGWRSFGPEKPFELNDLGRLNILLGPNGAGKSNLGRFTHWLAQQLAAAPGAPALGMATLHGTLFEFLEVDSWAREGGPLIAEFGVRISSLPERVQEWAKATYESAESFHVRVKASRQGDSDRWVASFVPHSLDGKPLFRLRDPKDAIWDVHMGRGGYQQIQNNKPERPLLLAQGLVECILRRWLRIPALRHPDAPSSLGSEINSRLASLSQDDRNAKVWTNVRTKLEGWMTRLLGDEVTIDATAEGVRLTSKLLGLPLLVRDAGDGIAQLVYLLAKLWLEPHQPMMVMIDEPEAHLHPGATVDLLEILENDFPWVQAIIATHSSAVVDAVSPEWKLWRVLRGEDGASVVEKVEAQPERIATLDALGVLPSQMFLARVVLWVEGPSDAIYYRRLLAEADKSLLFRRDFAFAIYGGSAGAALSLDDDPEAVIDVLRLAHRNILVYDSGSGEAVPGFVDRWAAALRDALPGAVFPTPGREVENLIDSEVLAQTVALCITEIRDDQGNLKVRLDPSAVVAERDSFATSLAASATRADGKQLTDGQRAAVCLQIERKKTKIARLIEASNAPSVFSDDALAWGRGLAEAVRAEGRTPGPGGAKRQDRS